MNYEVTDADLRRFRDALDWRLLDHATGSGILTPEEYQRWSELQRVDEICEVRVVEDAIAAAASETLRDRPVWRYWFAYREAREAIGAKHLPWLDEECNKALLSLNPDKE